MSTSDQQADNRVRVAFRLDDPSSHSSHELERAIIERLRENRVPATFAVIPFSDQDGSLKELTATQVPHLVEAHAEGLLEIALHGYSHTPYQRLPDNNQTEFAGRPLEEQIDLLVQGKACLEAIFSRVDGFVPPWNSFDEATLTALSSLNFAYLSGGWDYRPKQIVEFLTLPHTCNLPHLREAIAEARELRRFSPVVVVIMHHYDFQESGSGEAQLDITQLGELLAWISAQDDIALATLGDLAGAGDASSHARGIRYHWWREHRHWRLNRLLPQFVQLNVPAFRFYVGVTRHLIRHLPKAFAR